MAGPEPVLPMWSHKGPMYTVTPCPKPKLMITPARLKLMVGPSLTAFVGSVPYFPSLSMSVTTATYGQFSSQLHLFESQPLSPKPPAAADRGLHVIIVTIRS